jgi:hypothetical protein
MKKVRASFFDLAHYRAYCSHVRIPAKEFDPALEEGEPDGEVQSSIAFSHFFGTQEYFHSEMEAGLSAGANTFIVLKCRQSGMTTDGLNVLPYIAFQFSGVQCAFITHSGPLLNVSRMMLKKFYRSIDDPAWRYPIAEGGDNKEFLSFSNESTIYWLNANSNDEGGLGRGLPIRCTWGDEIGSWTDEEGIGSLFSSLSERNPKSLHVFAGTSRGPNLFKELYEEAEASGNLSQRAIFLGWWRHELYEHDLSDPLQAQAHKVYWGAAPRYTYDEARWVEGVQVRYGFEIRPTQLSWWRQHLAEKKKRNTALMYQEYPPLPEDAWIFGGSNFIDGRKLSRAATRIIELRASPRKYFCFDRGDGIKFENTTLVEVDPSLHYYDLICFAEPVLGERVRYALGVDPAHGANPESDHACIQVLQCYSDKAIQVAEFLARQLTTKELAWVILHIAGAYSSDSAGAHLCIELQGGGIQTYDEIKRLQNEAVYGYSPELLKYFSRLTHYQYMRPDTNARGNLTHWETTGRTRPRMLNHLRDLIATEYLDINSPELVRDCARITQLRDGYIEVPAQNHRVMAMACACMAYAQVQEMDIGLDKRFSIANLHANLEASGKEFLAPNEFMKLRLDSWRAGVMDVALDVQAEREGGAAGQSWIANQLGLQDDETDW